ncbi:Cyclic di-GMP phosphodiesterase CdgJ [Burkholderiales bacterium]|nr:Cyclic di-GMP phosphodiesterase CdgJ [Burkholderiales bacterium]
MSDAPNAFIGRQPIVDRSQSIIGYEMLFRASAEAETAEIGDAMAADANVLVNTFTNMGTESLVGNKLAFINVEKDLIAGNYLALLQPQGVVLELQLSVQQSPDLIERVKALREEGYAIALDDFDANPQQAAFLPVANYVKLDVRTHGLERCGQLAKALARFPVKKVAKKLENQAEFKFCRDANFDFFQGFFFAKPETVKARVVAPSFASIFHLLNLVRNGAEVSDIETALKRDMTLSYKLLRYINSAGFGLSCEIQSFRHAVAILGYQKLYRWLTLLLLTADKNGRTAPALIKTAVTRGRLMELLGEKHVSPSERDNLYVVGVFSMLDAILEMPMDAVLEQLNLPEVVNDALLHNAGVFAPFLQLAVACEDPEMKEVSELAGLLGITAQQLNSAHLEALDWVEKLGL